MDETYFGIAVNHARRTWSTKHTWIAQSRASFRKQADASQIKELIAFLGCVAQRLLQDGEIERVQLDSILSWAGAGHDWFLSSGYDAFQRASARKKAEVLIARELSGLQFVPASAQAYVPGVAEVINPSVPNGGTSGQFTQHESRSPDGDGHADEAMAVAVCVDPSRAHAAGSEPADSLHYRISAAQRAATAALCAEGPNQAMDALTEIAEQSDEKDCSTPRRRQHVPDCPFCAAFTPMECFPPHDASRNCEPGKHHHCTCDTCF